MLPFGGGSNNNSTPPLGSNTRNHRGDEHEEASLRRLREQVSLAMGRPLSIAMPHMGSRNPLEHHSVGHPSISRAVRLPAQHPGLDQVSRALLLAATQEQQARRDTALLTTYLEQALHRQRQVEQISSLQAHISQLRQALATAPSLALGQPRHQHQNIHNPNIQQERLNALRHQEDARIPSPGASDDGSMHLLHQAAATLPPRNERSGSSPDDRQPSPEGSYKTFPSERASLALDVHKARDSPAEAWKVLETLGKTLRGKADPYVDVSVVPDPGDLEPREKRRGASVFFPEVLYRLLDDVDSQGWQDIVSFLPHGRAFRVHNKHLFLDQLLPQYFVGQTKWSSFCRQLNIYGFLRVSSGPDYGTHPLRLGSAIVLRFG